MCKLHAGAKFSGEEYNFSGGLHGVGVSVVNALSETLEVFVKRDSKEYSMKFKNGDKKTDLKPIGDVGLRNTGTTIKFKPNEKYFESNEIRLKELKHLLKAKAVLCPGLTIDFNYEKKSEKIKWHFEDGLKSYLDDSSEGLDLVLDESIVSSKSTETQEVDFVINWLNKSYKDTLDETYVNLIPTAQGGSHLNGFKSGLLEAMKEFCEIRSILPKGLKINAEDVIANATFVISSKLQNPQFAGQTKERLSSKEFTNVSSQIIKDSFSLWLNQHTEEGEIIAGICIANAQARQKNNKKVDRKKIVSGPIILTPDFKNFFLKLV